MRIVVASAFGCSLSWWLRLAQEGNDVTVCIDHKAKQVRTVGDGLVNKAGWEESLEWAKVGYWSGIPTVVLVDSSGLGDKADEARKWGLPVIGGGRFCDKLEKNRVFGFEVAEQAGALIPPHIQFDSFTSALEYARGMEDVPIYFKSDRYLQADATKGLQTAAETVEYLEYLIRTYGGAGKCIIQKKIEGIPVSTARWWNGAAWVGPYEVTIEHKKLCNDDIGPSTGCAINAVWFAQETTPVYAQKLGWDRLTPLFAKEQAPPGLYDINAVATPGGELYFLEWTPRFGYDSEMTSGRLFSSLTNLIDTVTFGKGDPQPSTDLAYATRIGIPPYPWEFGKYDDPHGCVGDPIAGDVGDLCTGGFIGYELRQGEYGLEMASPEGIVGLAYAQGGPLKMLAKRARKAAEGVKASGTMFRTDGDKTLAKDAESLAEAGFPVHADMVN